MLFYLLLFFTAIAASVMAIVAASTTDRTIATCNESTGLVVEVGDGSGPMSPVGVGVGPTLPRKPNVSQ